MTTRHEIKAIPTKYNGIEFRSRLEARWAVFFDTLGIKYLYEYEGYQLPSGWYVPDFYLPEVNGGCFVEIKPTYPSSDEHYLCKELCGITSKDVFLQFGVIDIPLIIKENREPDEYDESDHFYYLEKSCAEGFEPVGVPNWSRCTAYCTIGICPECKSPQFIDLDGDDSEWLSRGSGCGCDISFGSFLSSPKLVAAYKKAQTFKFW